MAEDVLTPFATELFEEAKRFLEKAKETQDKEGHKAFLNASLLLGVSALEAHINAVADEMFDREKNHLNLLEQSILLEKDYTFVKGEFKLTKNLKIYRLVERIEFILFKFSGKTIDTNSVWWSKFCNGVDLRNYLVHPKSKQDITYEQVKSALEGILGLLDAMYKALYKQRFPALGRRLDSRMQF